MKCHYDVLGVALDVSDEDLKKSYRKLALKWHPDKNLDSVDLAREQFQLVQQAYEILSDPQERSWYDRHRDAILKGGLGENYQDNSLDVFPYFTTTCFKGYGDDTQGFYSVYREVFNKLITEDLEFVEDPEIVVPTFGSINSDYEECVHPFYAYWQSYSTKKTYSWLDPYDIRDTPNRRVLRLVEKENKKIRDKAKKERNEEVRNLVAFVRKRDPRIKAWAKVLEQRSLENAKKVQEKRQKVIKERQEKFKSYKEEEWSKFSNIENELKVIEENLAKEFNDQSHQDQEDLSDSQEDIDEEFYCPACNKIFKTDKSFINHEKSKKHKENVEVMKATLLDEEIVSSDSETDDNLSIEEDEDQPVINSVGSKSLESLKSNEESNTTSDNLSSLGSSNNKDVSESDENLDEIAIEKTKKQRKKKDKVKVQQAQYTDSDSGSELSVPEKTIPEKIDVGLGLPVDVPLEVEDDSLKQVTGKKLKGKKAKEARKQKKLGENSISKSIIKDNTLQEAADDAEDFSKINGLPPNPVKDPKDDKRAKRNPKKATVSGSKSIDVPNLDLYCVVCKNEFPSKNKLFDHLKKTGHSVYIPAKVNPEKSTTIKTSSKGKSRKSKV